MIEDDLDVLISTLERARAYQPRYSYRSLSHRLPLPSGHQHTRGLEGNLGAILFDNGAGGILGHNWIAASTRVRPHIEDQAARNGDTIVSLRGKDNNRQVVWKAAVKGAVEIVASATLHPTDPCQKNDTEVALLNALHASLQQLNLTSGHAVLLTERVPCASCTDVIEQFVKQNPNVSLSVAYLADYVSSKVLRSHVEFHAQLAALSVTNVALFKLDKDKNNQYELAEVGVDEPLLEVRTTNFGPGTEQWCGQNPDGSARKEAWRPESYLALRRILRCQISKQK